MMSPRTNISKVMVPHFHSLHNHLVISCSLRYRIHSAPPPPPPPPPPYFFTPPQVFSFIHIHSVLLFVRCENRFFIMVQRMREKIKTWTRERVQRRGRGWARGRREREKLWARAFFFLHPHFLSLSASVEDGAITIKVLREKINDLWQGNRLLLYPALVYPSNSIFITIERERSCNYYYYYYYYFLLYRCLDDEVDFS